MDSAVALEKILKSPEFAPYIVKEQKYIYNGMAGAVKS